MSNPNFIDLFSGHSAIYAKYRPTYPEQIYTDIKNYLTKDVKVIVDIGCGSGQAVVDLAKHFKGAKVIGVEPSPQQLEQAPKMDNVEYRCAKAEQTGLPDGIADLITVATAIHWFDLDLFWKEVDRILAPGGVIAVWTNGTSETHVLEADKIYKKFFGEILPYFAPQAHMTFNKYKDIIFPYEKNERKITIYPREMPFKAFIDYLGSWSSVQKYLEKDPHILEQTEKDMATALKLKDPRDPVTIYWEIVLLLAQKPEK
eukprot:TRINITY_DN1778_c0_g1_i1.p1 TRINITY_DN1778_c0_g1~~TRINITY_DN1778_c0_g1_i1.p1  ORF type:complete len:258 (-),score=47.92 TRINITY_DN1778_c0_g1_i1:137-910(-)